MKTKSEWREWARGVDRASHSAAVRRHLGAWPPLHGTVLSYLAMDDEVSLAATHELDRCRIAVTRTPPEGPLSVHLLEDGLLEEHRLGFLQPSPKSPEVSLDEVEVVLVPGLAFDHSGNRLGRGKGYYDGLLSSLPAGVVRVGVTVDELIVDVLPTEEHDERVAWIATESGIRRAGDPLPEATNRFVSSAVLAGVAPEIHRFPEGTKTSADAAAAVGAELGEIAKSILFSVDGEPVLVICSGDRRINESLLADSLGASHVRIADLDEVRGWTGYVAGGTPGVGLSPEVRVVADSSLARYRWVWSAGGTPDTVYPISLARLVGASGARWVDVSDRGKT